MERDRRFRVFDVLIVLAVGQRAPSDLMEGEEGFELRLMEEGILKNESEEDQVPRFNLKQSSKDGTYSCAEQLRHGPKADDFDLGVEKGGGSRGRPG